jgi:hypothetical protein
VYRQGEHARRRRGGAGLGLAITRRLIEMHQGTITIDSEVGRGSSFCVTIPRLEGIEIADPSAEHQRPSFFSVTDVRERARYASMPEVKVPPARKTPKSDSAEPRLAPDGPGGPRVKRDVPDKGGPS